MTPNLAGFVAFSGPPGSGPPGSGSLSAGSADGGTIADTRGDLVAAVLAALGEEFTLVPEPERPAPPGQSAMPANPARATLANRAPRRRTWLDTFDWRLYRAGLLLEHVSAHRGGELRLAARPDQAPSASAVQVPAGPLAVQPTTGWQSARPHLAGDLPAGPVADRIARVIGPRALLPLVTVTTSVTVTRLLNEDAKTVARLLVEYPVLTGMAGGIAAVRAGGAAGGTVTGRAANGTGQRLPPRVTIAEVRGYSGPARRAARVIADTAGFLPARGDLFTEALAVSGRSPGDYSNKIDAKVTGDLPSSQAVAVVVLRLLDMAEANVPGVLSDTDTEFLHDFRVAVRRTRAALKLFGDALGRPADVARFAAEFKWLGDATTPARDLDVHLLGFEDMARSLKAAKPDELEPFRDYLHGKRAKEYRALARALRSQRFRDLTREWRAALTPAGEGKRPKEPRISAATVAAESTRKAFMKVARLGAAITPDSPHESLHNLRKRCKELRYALEFFTPLYDPALYGRVIGDLKRLQDCLGTFQDNEVQIAEIRSLATAMLAANDAPAVTLLAMGEVTAALADAQVAARADFGRRFAEFAGVEGQRRMSVLLRLTAREIA